MATPSLRSRPSIVLVQQGADALQPLHVQIDIDPLDAGFADERFALYGLYGRDDDVVAAADRHLFVIDIAALPAARDQDDPAVVKQGLSLLMVRNNFV